MFLLLLKNQQSILKTFQRLMAAAATPAGGGGSSGGGAPGTKLGKLGGGIGKKAQHKVKKVELQVETDPHKLAKFCCGLNILKTGGTEVELKADSEYPDWLWKLYLDKGPTLEEMKKDGLDENTLEYWIRKRRIAIRYKSKLLKKRFPQPFIPKNVLNLRLA